MDEHARLGAAFQLITTSADFNLHEGSMTAISGRVRGDVARVTVSVSGRTVDGAVSDGTFDVWWPAVGTGDTAVTIHASGAEGTQVATLSLTVAGFGTG